MERDILVFVYGSLKRGYGNHFLLEDAEWIGTGFIENFKMYSLGAFPAIVPTPDREGLVWGELYKVNEEEFASLDMLEGYPHFYNRKQVTVWEPVDAAAPAWQKYNNVWVYFHEDPYMRENVEWIEDGFW